MSITEQAGKVGTAAVSAMAATPLAIALLIVNIGFLGFAGYMLGLVAGNTSERNQQQMDLISSLIKDCRAPSTRTNLPSWLPPATLPIGGHEAFKLPE